jgi:hypothetical protein
MVDTGISQPADCGTRLDRANLTRMNQLPLRAA